MSVMSTLLDMDVPFSMKQVADWVLRVIPLVADPAGFFPVPPPDPEAAEERFALISDGVIFVRAAVGRARTAEGLSNYWRNSTRPKVKRYRRFGRCSRPIT